MSETIEAWADRVLREARAASPFPERETRRELFFAGARQGADSDRGSRLRPARPARVERTHVAMSAPKDDE